MSAVSQCDDPEDDLHPDDAVALPEIQPFAPHRRQESFVMVSTQAEALRKAIENLIDAKLHDAMSKPGGLDRLLAHRRTGVASYDIRQAERKLQDSIAEMLVPTEPAYAH